ncbi:SurA N-terminal domain-containing protein [Sphingomonas sp. HF-S3]|uniref:Parvulin-like PPIase n=1 Tax=Sphingomonas rustica TaxID=3103142 RepID=A0ABV0B6H9_9SPHN
MLGFFRSFAKSRGGLIVVFLLLGLIAVAFALGDVTGLSNPAGPKGAVVATVGKQKITDTQVREVIDRFITQARRNGQNITMEQFLAQGGLDLAVNELIKSAALEEFGNDTGIRVDNSVVDAQIANTPAFQGVDGKFNQDQFNRVIADARISASALRDDFARERLETWLLDSPASGNFMPAKFVAPYAALPLQRRTGEFTMLRWQDAAFPGEPDDKTLAAYYNANRAAYMIPQRRVIRYAMVPKDYFATRAAPTEAEIADAYRKSADRFAATEKRTIRQLVILDQAGANSAAAEAKAGKSITDIAKARGLEPRVFDAVDKATLTKASSAEVANAAFAAAQGGVVGPVRAQGGYAVLQVETVEKIPAKTLDQARAELTSELTTAKTIQSLAALRQSIEDGIGNGQTFDQLMQAAKLTPQQTAAITAAGINPDDPNSKPDPALAPVVQGAFGIDPDSQDPVIVPIDQEGGFAVAAISRVVQPAARPMASIRKQVRDDYLKSEAMKVVRANAEKLVGEMKKGTPMAQAMAKLGIRGVPPKAFDVKFGDLTPQAGPQAQLAFSMPAKSAKWVQSPDRQGYFVVYVATIQEGDARGNAQLMAGATTALSRTTAAERRESFLEAIKRHVGVTRNEAAIGTLRANLLQTGIATR